MLRSALGVFAQVDSAINCFKILYLSANLDDIQMRPDRFCILGLCLVDEKNLGR
jgi:hypothetical protein